MDINFKYIVKIQDAIMRIFEAEDDDYPNGKVVASNNRAIEHYLDLITKDEDKRIEIYNTIEKNNFNINDLTFKPICDDLRKLGYNIIFDKEK